MSKRKAKDQCYEDYYHKYKVPDKMLYIMRVMDSCKTKEQLDAAFKWGDKLVRHIYDIASDKFAKDSTCREFLAYDNIFRSNTFAAVGELHRYYHEKDVR